MTRLEIRRRALRAATAVSLTTLTLAAFGCDGSVSVETAAQEESDPPAPPPTTTATPPIAPPDLGPIFPSMVADAGADAAVDNCPCPEGQDMFECCNEQSWLPACGCEAWGPPMPPSMEVA